MFQSVQPVTTCDQFLILPYDITICDILTISSRVKHWQYPIWDANLAPKIFWGFIHKQYLWICTTI